MPPDNITLKIVRGRGRTTRMKVVEDGTVVVNAPWHASKNQILNFAKQKTPWIKQQLSLIGSLYDFSQPTQISQITTIQVVDPKSSFSEREGITLIRTPIENSANDWQVFLAIKNQIKRILLTDAKKVLPNLLENEVARLNLKMPTYKIKYQKSRWGSCSAHSNINLNSQLVRLPESLILSVIDHELAHLTELNHSQKYYGVLNKYDTDFKQNRKQLMQYRLFA